METTIFEKHARAHYINPTQLYVVTFCDQLLFSDMSDVLAFLQNNILYNLTCSSSLFFHSLAPLHLFLPIIVLPTRALPRLTTARMYFHTARWLAHKARYHTPASYEPTSPYRIPFLSPSLKKTTSFLLCCVTTPYILLFHMCSSVTMTT